VASTELAGALEEAITRAADIKLWRELDAVFEAFKSGLTALCYAYGTELPEDAEFEQRLNTKRRRVFELASDGSRLRVTEQFLRRIASGD